MHLSIRPLAFAAAICGISVSAAAPAHAEHVRDLAEVAGARENQLVGYGIVTGLSGTGDDVSAPFATQSTMALLRRLGVQSDSKQIRLKNVAAVIVTATLPAFAKPGTKIDITVSSIGNAKSIASGTLVQSLLRGGDGQTYAVGQGNVIVSGFEAKGGTGSSVKSGATTAGRIPEGAIVEREVATSIINDGRLRLELRTPGFTVAARMTEAIDKKFGVGTARAVDGGSVSVSVPSEYAQRPVELLAALEDVEVTVVRKARIVLNERTGTIVAGGDVRLAPVAIVHGSLTITINESPLASQPTAPILGSTGGRTVLVPRTEINTNEKNRAMTYVAGAPTLSDLSRALGALGLSPRELTSVFGALRSAGALEAEIVTQ